MEQTAGAPNGADAYFREVPFIIVLPTCCKKMLSQPVHCRKYASLLDKLSTAKKNLECYLGDLRTSLADIYTRTNTRI